MSSTNPSESSPLLGTTHQSTRTSNNPTPNTNHDIHLDIGSSSSSHRSSSSYESSSVPPSLSPSSVSVTGRQSPVFVPIAPIQPIGEPRQESRRRVRESMLRDLVTQARLPLLSLFLVALVLVPQLCFIIYYSIEYADKWNSCDKPLNLWLILFGARLMLSTIVVALPVCSPRHWNALSRRYKAANDLVNLIGLTIFIIGSFWIFDTHTCPAENPHIYKLAYWLIMIQYALLLLPCVLICCVAPCIFLCLPLLIRVSGYLPIGVGLRMAGQRGAPPNLISKLPPPRTYEIGMFEVAPSEGNVHSTRTQRTGSDPTATDHSRPECAICISNYTVGESVRQLPCNGRHHFHQACIDDWLKINNSCPICRTDLLEYMNNPQLWRDRVEDQEARSSFSINNDERV